MRKLVALSLFAMLLLGGGWFGSREARAGGSTITVNTTAITVDANDGVCSLVEAIKASNTDSTVGNCTGSGEDAIVFSLPNPSTINLGATDLDPIIDTVEINGALPGGGKVQLLGDPAENDGMRVGDFATEPAAGSAIRNLVINGFLSGIFVLDSDVTITGNYIGTNVTGTAIGGTAAGGASNSTGISIQEAGNVRIGGTSGVTPGGVCTGECNLISGNSLGIQIASAGTGNVVQGNHIGTNRAGTSAIGNSTRGIYVRNLVDIGGSGTGEGNVISGNGTNGIEVVAAAPNIRGNRIGTNASGTAALPNLENGIRVEAAESGFIGGEDLGDGNVISGNGETGIVFLGASNVAVLGNRIGTSLDGNDPIPNGGDGVFVGSDSTNDAERNTIGGNVIAFNSVDGIAIDGSNPEAVTARNTITFNSIHDNGGKGIGLYNGGNANIAPPTISQATGSGASGTACAQCVVEIFSDSADEGRTLETIITAEVDGSWTVNQSFAGPNITATNRDGVGNTSEFSAPVAVPQATPTPTLPPTASPAPTPTSTATPTATGTPSSTTVGPTIAQTETATPTATPTSTTSANRVWGDSDCDGQVKSRDNQAVLRNVLGQPALSQTEPCPNLGDAVTVDGATRTWGDWDCSGAITARDNQALLRHVLSQPPLSQTEPCPDVGSEVGVA